MRRGFEEGVGSCQACDGCVFHRESVWTEVLPEGGKHRPFRLATNERHDSTSRDVAAEAFLWIFSGWAGEAFCFFKARGLSRDYSSLVAQSSLL